MADPEAASGPLRAVAPVAARRALVVAAHPLAVRAGLDVLHAGGNAVDVAVAAAYALNVVEPQSSGIGGGAFVLIYLAGRGEVVALDGREEAPFAARRGYFLRPDGTPEPFFPDRITGGRPVGVPGAVRVLERARAEYGRLKAPQVLAPAIRLADGGVPVSGRLAALLRVHRGRLARFPATRALLFGADGGPLREGARLRQPDLARTLALIAAQGDGAFHGGAMAEDIVRAVTEAPVNPGVMTLADLEGYRAVRRAPTVGRFRGYTVYGMGPPSSGGVAVQQMLTLLEASPPPAPGAPPAASIHRFAQAARLAYADRARYLADPDFVPVPVRGLLDAAYSQSRARALAWDEPLAPADAGTPPGAGAVLPGRAEEDLGLSTTHLVAVDAERNVVALTATIEQAFGSGMVVPGRGFLLNNELTDFDARDEDEQGRPLANRVEGGRRPRASALDSSPGAGGKRPRSSMAPTLVLKDGRPVLAVGSPGGPRIIQFVAAVLLRVLEQRVPVQQAIEAPHATHLDGVTAIEPELDSPPLRQALERLGHRVTVARQASGLHAVWIDPVTGTLDAGIDPRRDGAAAGD